MTLPLFLASTLHTIREAFSRWRHPYRYVNPARFIVAEDLSGCDLGNGIVSSTRKKLPPSSAPPGPEDRYTKPIGEKKKKEEGGG